MSAWWIVVMSDCLIPVVMIIVGRMSSHHTPKDINYFLGYRTKMSMLNMDTWNFAHIYIGKLWWKVGWVLLVPTILIHIPFYGKSDDTLGIFTLVLMCIHLVIMLVTIIPTEKALHHTFNQDGSRKGY